MATFTVDERDLEDLIRRDLWQELRYRGIWPAVSFGAALALYWLHPVVSAIVFGMGLAWSFSLFQAIRGIRPWYATHHGRMGGPVTVEFRDEGLWTAMPLGEGIIRWDQLSAIKNYSACFVLEDENDELLILPKRHFSTAELVLLQSKATEISRKRSSEAAG
jgi:hypothetical protein